MKLNGPRILFIGIIAGSLILHYMHVTGPHLHEKEHLYLNYRGVNTNDNLMASLLGHRLTKDGNLHETLSSVCNDFNKTSFKSNTTNLPNRLLQNIRYQSLLYKNCGGDDLLNPNIALNDDTTNHFTQRNTIRRTWASVSQLGYKKKIKTIFLIGKPSYQPDVQQNFLAKENEIYQDILQCDTIDSYHNMTIKVLSAYRWVLSNKLRSEHYTFCDDDTSMNISNIYRYLNTIKNKTKQDFIACPTKHSNVKPQRIETLKWYISYDLYNTATYPPYCSGMMYTIPWKTLHDIYCVAEITNGTGFFIDDVYITGILRQKLGISEDQIFTLTRDERFSYYVMYAKSTSHAGNNYILEGVWKKFKESLENFSSEIGIVPEEVEFKSFSHLSDNELELGWKNLGFENVANLKYILEEKHNYG